jgi:hypothetical protein
MNDVFRIVRPVSRFGSPVAKFREDYCCAGERPWSASGRTHWRGRYGIDALLILVPLLGSVYFLWKPAVFNAALAWLFPYHP